MRAIKYLKILLVLILLATGCNKIGGLASREPSANDCRKVLENRPYELLGIHAGELQILEVEKIRAYEQTVRGDLVCIVDIRVKFKYLPKGRPAEVASINISLPFDKTNKGFLGWDRNIY